MIHVCSLAALPETVRTTRASHVLTVMGKVDQVQRPASIRPENHLKVSVDDITEPMDGFVMPSDEHVTQVLDFVRGWDRGAAYLEATELAGFSREEAKRLFGRDPGLPDAVREDYLTPWNAAKAEKRFLARFKALEA